MTDQTTPQAPTFTEAPASWNVRYLLNGYECQLTLRGQAGSDVLKASQAALDWLGSHGATPAGKATAAPAPAAPASQPGQPAAPNGAPAQPPASQPQPANGAGETIQVQFVKHVVTDNGKHCLKVKGGRYTQHGITAWTEAIPAQGWEQWQIGQDFAAPTGMHYAVLSPDSKKVISFHD